MSAARWLKVRADVPQYANMRALAKSHGIPLEIHEKASMRGIVRYRIGKGPDRVTVQNPIAAWAELRRRAGVTP